MGAKRTIGSIRRLLENSRRELADLRERGASHEAQAPILKAVWNLEEELAAVESAQEACRAWVTVVTVGIAALSAAVSAVAAWQTHRQAVLAGQQLQLTVTQLQAQIGPEVDVRLDRKTGELVIDNTGAVPVVEGAVTGEVHVFVGGLRRAMGSAAPICKWNRLEPGESHRCSLQDAAATAMQDAAALEKASRGGVIDPVVVARVQYRREADRKIFSKASAYLALCCGANGKPTVFPGLGVPGEVDDAIHDMALGTLARPRRLGR